MLHTKSSLAADLSVRLSVRMSAEILETMRARQLRHVAYFFRSYTLLHITSFVFLLL